MTRSAESIRKEIDGIKRRLNRLPDDSSEAIRLRSDLRRLQTELQEAIEEEQFAALYFLLDENERKDLFGF